MPYFQAAQRSPATFQAHQLFNGRDRQVTEPVKYYLGQLVQKREVEVKFGPHRTFGSNDHDGNYDQGNPDHRDFIIVFFRILCNKPVRPPMVSTLQQRWAATGGMPPQ